MLIVQNASIKGAVPFKVRFNTYPPVLIKTVLTVALLNLASHLNQYFRQPTPIRNLGPTALDKIQQPYLIQIKIKPPKHKRYKNTKSEKSDNYV